MCSYLDSRPSAIWRRSVDLRGRAPLGLKASGGLLGPPRHSVQLVGEVTECAGLNFIPPLLQTHHAFYSKREGFPYIACILRNFSKCDYSSFIIFPITPVIELGFSKYEIGITTGLRKYLSYKKPKTFSRISFIKHLEVVLTKIAKVE